MEYYKLGGIRDQLLMTGKVDHTSVLGFPEDWNYCHCFIIEQCARQNRIICSTPIQIAVFINNPNIGITVIEVVYKRETREGYVRANSMKLNQLIEKGVINVNLLERETF